LETPGIVVQLAQIMPVKEFNSNHFAYMSTACKEFFFRPENGLLLCLFGFFCFCFYKLILRWLENNRKFDSTDFNRWNTFSGSDGRKSIDTFRSYFRRKPDKVCTTFHFSFIVSSTHSEDKIKRITLLVASL
jgi:hypothetical protein